MINFYKEKKNDYLLYSGFLGFIFFWDLKIEFIQGRFLILLCFIPLIKQIIEDHKLKNNHKIKIFLFFSLFFFIHLVFNFLYENKSINIYNIVSFAAFLYILAISIFININSSNFIFNLNKIFLIFFILSCLIGVLLKIPDAPHFCGGIPDMFSFFEHKNYDPKRIGSPYKVSFSEFIFQENSHLAMVAPGVICYGFYKIFRNKNEYIFKLLTLIFFIICFIKSSLTLILGLISSLLLINIFNFKKISIKVKSTFILVIIIFTISFIYSDECKNRLIKFSPNSKTTNTIENQMTDAEDFNKSVNQSKVKNLLSKLDSNNLSSSIYSYHLILTLKSINDRPLGWGINRYEEAVNFYKNSFSSEYIHLNKYNSKDGTNNVFKIFVEFGYFGLVFYFYLFKYIISDKIRISHKLFFIPILVTQLIRGAGYFNGGFILIFFIVLFQLIKLKK